MDNNNSKSKRSAEILKDFSEAGIMSDREYEKKDVVPELKKFQNMIVSKVFEENHGEYLRIADVQAHINSIAEEEGIISDEKIVEFNALSDDLSKLIGHEISGAKGEKRMIHNLEMIQVENEHLTNVELSREDFTTELDGVVITSKAIFLIEAKYSICDMSITLEGNYCRTKEEDVVYCNIGDKINDKVYLIRKVLKEKGFDKKINIYKLVVNTNNNTKLTNNYGRYIKTCTCNQLHYIIEDFKGEDIYTDEDRFFIKNALLEANEVKKYPVDFDFDRYKALFADVLVMIENPQEKRIDQETVETKKIDWAKIVKYGVKASGIVAIAISSVISKKGINMIKEAIR